MTVAICAAVHGDVNRYSCGSRRSRFAMVAWWHGGMVVSGILNREQISGKRHSQASVDAIGAAGFSPQLPNREQRTGVAADHRCRYMSAVTYRRANDHQISRPA